MKAKLKAKMMAKLKAKMKAKSFSVFYFPGLSVIEGQTSLERPFQRPNLCESSAAFPGVIFIKRFTSFIYETPNNCT